MPTRPPCGCLPVGLDLAAKWVFKSCDCTPAAYCKHFQPWPNTTRYEPCIRSPIDTIHGGGGAILSSGALKLINPARMLDCAHGGGGEPAGPGNCAGSDCYLTQCLWKEGIGHTDPGWQMRHPEEFLFDMYRGDRARMLLELNAAFGGTCDEGCLGRLTNQITLHVGRTAKEQAGNPEEYAKLIQRLVGAYTGFVETVLQPPAVVGG